jgi:hypothetical protein
VRDIAAGPKITTIYPEDGDRQVYRNQLAIKSCHPESTTKLDAGLYECLQISTIST